MKRWFLCIKRQPRRATESIHNADTATIQQQQPPLHSFRRRWMGRWWLLSTCGADKWRHFLIGAVVSPCSSHWTQQPVGEQQKDGATMETLLNISTHNQTIAQDYNLSPMHKYFLVTLILALLNLLLGIIYGYIRYFKNRHNCCKKRTEYQRSSMRRQSVSEGVVYKSERRKTSTHIVLAAAQSKQAARRMSSAYLWSRAAAK